ncbi:MAG: protease modulator HflC [Verrucomicrobiota bacterium]|nr:protease modulator HflC [Verrucomicrobiota bacterium]
MKTLTPILLILAIAGVVLIANSAYVVDETEQVVITQFGMPVGSAVTEAGLHWRKPFIQKVNRFEKRILAFDGSPEQMPTSDKVYITIDTFARWRIADPMKFFKAVRDENSAKTVLDDIIDGATLNTISSNSLIEVVRNTNRELQMDDLQTARDPENEEFGIEPAVLPQDLELQGPGTNRVEDISLGRNKLTQAIFEASKTKIEEYGIELLDMNIKRVNYAQEVRQQVYQRMISERMQIAERFRSEGEQFRLAFLGQISREKDRLMSEAYAKAETVRGEGEAEAARIFAEAYNMDPEFFRLWRTLELYRTGLLDQAILVLDTDNPLFQVLKGTTLPVE